jgi:putative heme iron utilization protein
MRTAHQVPKELRENSTRTMRATLGLRTKPTDAERSRTHLLEHKTGSLATLSAQCPGFPFGSLVAYAVDATGRPILALSDIAEHSRNVAADPRGSLIVTHTDTSGSEDPDPLALSRLTLIGEIVRLAGAEREAALEIYREAHPGANYTDFGDFQIYRLEVAAVRYVGGFGRMSWVSLEDYLAAEPDPIRTHVRGIIEHMNADHTDALVAFARVHGKSDDVAEAVLAAVNRYGMELLVRATGADEQRTVWVPFPSRLDDTDQVRPATIRLVREARERLGIPQPAGHGSH